jgi:6-pyruvoyltetrahydropterin/6-carboxytetrahydropterin synthase
MLLTLSKRIDFSASRRLFNAAISPDENRRLFGDESAARYGTGRNYTAYCIFSGQPDATTGMLINISDIKKRAASVIDDRYDHRFLNEDNASFRTRVPTAENIASQIFTDVAPLFADESATLVAVHLRECPNCSATAYTDGTVEANYWFEFSAARQTRSPRLSDAENQNLFGVSIHEHGHNYRTRLTLSGKKESIMPLIPAQEIGHLISSLRTRFDHKNLSQDVEELRERPTTTEALARFILQVALANGIARVRLHERDDFFAEAWRDGGTFLGMRRSFSAAHRLHVASFSEARNAELFGKCNNPRGHGHRYITEATIGGEYDMRTGTLYSFEKIRGAIDGALDAWRNKHLDLETQEFRSHPSTGENIVRALWPKLDSALEQRLVRLRLWETENNRFTLRRT